ncbi:YadA-like family protein, partial [uncultured Haemophilus sp.]|uniref:YadA-like family protein n=1 Tax=uncultured Haemophilus sp. TaxID=237779 RepID=UPI002586855B
TANNRVQIGSGDTAVNLTVDMQDAEDSGVLKVAGKDGNATRITNVDAGAYTMEFNKDGDQLVQVGDKYYVVDPETGVADFTKESTLATEEELDELVKAKPELKSYVAYVKAASGLADLENSHETNALTVADAQKLGWVVSAGDYAANVTNANEVRFNGSNGISVTGETDENGVRNINVSIAKGKVDGNTTTGVATGDTNYVTGDQVAKAINESGWKTNVTNATTGLPETKVVTPGTQVDYVNGNGTTANVTLKDGKVAVSYNVNQTTGSVNPNGTATVTDGNAFLNASTVANLVNNSAFNVTTAKVDAFAENQEGKANAAVKAGGNITYTAGKNIAISQNGSNFTFSTTKDIEVDSVTANNRVQIGSGDTAVNLTTDLGALQVADKDGNATQITNVEAGTNVMAFNKEGDQLVQVGDKFYVVDPETNEVDFTKESTPATEEELDELAKAKPALKAYVAYSKAASGLADLDNSEQTNALTVADAQRLGWVVSASGNDYADSVTNANEVRFNGSNGISVTGETDEHGVRNINVSIAKGNVAGNTTTGVATGDTNYVTGDQVANAINNSGWKTTATKVVDEAGNEIVDANKATAVNPGDSVNYVDGNSTKANVVVTKAADGKETVNVSYDLVTEDHLTPVANDAKSVTKPTNIDAKGKDAATVNDVLNAGWNLQANDEAVDAVTHGNNVNFTSKDGSVKITAKSDGSTSSLDFAVNATSIVNQVAGTISYNKDGKATTNGDGKRIATVGDVANTINNTGWLTNVTDAKGNVTTKVVTPNTQVNYVNGDGTKANVVANSTTGGLDVTFNVKSANPETLTVDGNGVKVNTGSITEATDVAGDANRGKVTVAAGEGNKVATVQNVANAINSASWTVKVADTQEEITTSTANDEGSSVRAGNEITHVAGKNLKVKRDGRNVTYALANDVSVNTVTAQNSIKVGAGNAATTVTTSSAQDGVTEVKLADAAGKATRITNVAAGVKDTDAVNVSQLRNSNAQINQNIAHLNNKVNRMGKDLRAGIAGSNAAAGLPQVYIPGKSMVAAAAGTFKGQSAVAVGYSRASDNGKVILKLQGNANTRGDVGGSVGVGYQW